MNVIPFMMILIMFEIKNSPEIFPGSFYGVAIRNVKNGRPTAMKMYTQY